MTSHRRGSLAKSRRTVSQQFQRAVIETLEERRMLTALFGNDTYAFQQAPGQEVQIHMNGNIMAEFVGGVVDDTNHLLLSDLPGQWDASGTGRAPGSMDLGGVGGRSGVQVIGPTVSNEVAQFPQGTIGRRGAGQNYNGFQALASTDVGNTYGFNVGKVAIPNIGTDTFPDRQLVQLDQLNTSTGAGTVQAMIQQATLREDTVAGYAGIQGNIGDVAIDPTDGTMYVVISGGGAGNNGGNLYTVDRTTGAVALVGTVRSTVGGQLTTAAINAMAFDSTGQLWMITQDYDNNANNDASGLPTGPAPDPQTPAPTSTTDIALIAVNKLDATFTPSDTHVIQTINTTDSNFYETLNTYTAMTYDAVGNRFYVAATPPQNAGGGGGGGGGAGSNQELETIPVPAGIFGPVRATRVGDITVASASGGGGGGGGAGNVIDTVDGLAFAVDRAGNRILVGLQETTVGNGRYPRLVSINLGAPDKSVALSEPNSIVRAGGLASYTEAGDTKPLLWTATNNLLVRGSAVCLTTNDDGTSAVNAVRGAAFNPIDHLVYFVDEEAITGTGGGGGGGGGNAKSVLYTVDVNAGNRSQIQNSIAQLPGTFTNLVSPVPGSQPADGVITALAFDQTSDTTADLWGWDSKTGALCRVSVNNTDASRLTLPVLMIGPGITTQPTTVPNDSITGLAFFGDDLNKAVGDDPNNPQTFIYAVENTAENSQLLRVRISNPDVALQNWQGAPTALAWGSVVAPHLHTTAGDMVGEGLQDLTWNAGMINPATHQRGALLATDTLTDQLVFIDYRLRSPNINIYSIHITQSDANSYIGISTMLHDRADQPPPTGPNYPVPFSGDSGTFRIVDFTANPVQQVIINAPGNTGQVLIGIKTNDVDCVTFPNPTLANDDLKPILSDAEASNLPDMLRAPITDPFGMVSVNDGWLPQGLDLPEGGILQTVTNPSSAMIGTVARVLAASSDLAGNIAVLDSSRLAIIPAGGTRAGNLVNVRNAANVTLDRIQAAQWGDPNNTGTESLYAIYPVAGVPTLGTIDADPTSATYGLFTPIGAVGGGAPLNLVQAMAFSGAHLYVVDDTGSLYEIDPATGNIVGAGALVTGLPTIKSMDFSGTGRLYADDIQNGRLIDIDINASTFGQNVATPDGSLRASVGAITYNPNTGRFYALDNAFQGPGVSTMLLQVTGLSNLSAVPQDIGRFLVGGTFMGNVSVSGSIGTFYAGWLMTGAAYGQPIGAAVAVPDNFRAGGEIRDVEVLSSIGTNTNNGVAPNYDSGFQLHAGGKVGQVHAAADILGAVWADNTGLAVNSMQSNVTQREFEPNAPGGLVVKTTDVPTAGGDFMQGYVSNAAFFNDTFQSAQYLGTVNTTLGNNVIQLWGSIAGDNTAPDAADYYSVALMAGQSIVVQLTDQPDPLALPCTEHIGVYDPDGRLIATDFSDVDPATKFHQPFVVTADRPGLYRFAIGVLDPHPLIPGDYELRITASPDGKAVGPGNLGIGAVSAGGSIVDGITGTEFKVSNGDMGGVSAGTFYACGGAATVALETAYTGVANPPPVANAMQDANIDVLQGNMRAISAASVGFFDPNLQAYSLGVDLHAINGAVGLVSATGTGTNDCLYLNKSLVLSGPPSVDEHQFTTMPGAARQAATGGSYQMVSSATNFVGAIMTNGSIGTVRAASMPSGASYFVVNASDNANTPASIDLIDTPGNLGNPLSGGPAFITGPSGNIRFIHVGGIAYRDRYFGLAAPGYDLTRFQPGETASFIDDSGAAVSITPQMLSGVAPQNQPFLTIATYGIRDHGGVALVSVSSPTGINIYGTTDSPNGTVEIGTLTLAGGAGAGQTNLYVGGTAMVDLYDTTGPDFNQIINNSGGEFTNMTVGNVNYLAGTDIGIAKHSTPAAVNGQTIRANALPFVQQRIAINTGSIGVLTAKHAIGNINANGTIGQVIANSDHSRAAGQFYGIAGPVFATGRIADVSIGQGIASSGTGEMGLAGIYSNDSIGIVRGTGADIRGNIVAPNGIGSIQLSGNGSIIDADILVTPINLSREFDTGGFGNGGGPVTNPIFDLGSISIIGGGTAIPPLAKTTSVAPKVTKVLKKTVAKKATKKLSKKQKAALLKRRKKKQQQHGGGSVTPPPITPPPAAATYGGGIIGAYILAGNVGPVSVSKGYGIIDSTFQTNQIGVMSGFNVDGYGIRDTLLISGTYIRNIVLNGRGQSLPVNTFSPTVRNSEFTTRTFIPTEGTGDYAPQWEPNRINDLHEYLGTDPTSPNPVRATDHTTDAGVIAGTTVRASRELTNLNAWAVWSSDRTGVYTPSDFDVANRIVTFNTVGDSFDMNVTTGNITSMIIGGYLVGPRINVAGIFSNLQINASLLPQPANDSGFDGIFASGSNGQISNILVKGGVNLPIKAQRKIGKWTVQGINSGFGRFGPRGSITQGNRQLAP